MSLLQAYNQFTAGMRVLLLYAGIGVAAVCAYDWAVRTRRINSFSKSARFFRGHVEPLMRPVERTIVRAGGSPSAAPWWTIVAFAVLGVVLITLLEFGADVLGQVIGVVRYPGELPRMLLSWSFSILRLALLVRVLSSWVSISPFSRWIRWSFALTDWMINPLRRLIPSVGPFDISPLIAWFGLSLLQSMLRV